MSEFDPLLSPTDLRRLEPKFGVALQRKRRKAGDFIPHIQINNRYFYRLSSVKRWLADQEVKTVAPAADAPAPKPLTLGDDSLAETLAKIIKTAATSEEARTRIAELLGGADESGERLWNGGTDDAA